MEDVLIIGGGIIGSLIAYQCSKYHCNVTLLEKDLDIANATTAANSAIIHAGYDPDDYTLKAEMNVKGARMYASLCRELKVAYKQIGSLVVATNEEELASLKRLKKQADQRGIHTRIIDRMEIEQLEEHIAEGVTHALLCEQTAVVTPWSVAIAAMEEAMANQVKCECCQEVLRIEKNEGIFTVTTQDKEFKARMVINCAGLYADDINEMATGKRSFEINPRKGEYFVLSKDAGKFVKHVIYPAPSKASKGILVVPTVHGNILLGPNAFEHSDKTDTSTTQQGMEFVRENLNKIVKDIPYPEIIHSFAGNRPACDRRDFIIEESEVENFINVAGIESPGLASAPAIASYVVEKFVLKKFDFQKRMFIRHRSSNVVMSECTTEEKQRYIELNPKYGEIVCRCEQISAQEIIDCIKRKCGARSVVGVKKRVRPGMGKCQGGFCEPMIIELLSETLGIDKKDVPYNHIHSHELLKKSKGE